MFNHSSRDQRFLQRIVRLPCVDALSVDTSSGRRTSTLETLFDIATPLWKLRDVCWCRFYPVSCQVKQPVSTTLFVSSQNVALCQSHLLRSGGRRRRLVSRDVVVCPQLPPSYSFHQEFD